MKSEKQILCENLEHWETPEWAVQAILRKEILTRQVIDPCTGTGVMSRIAKNAGYSVTSYDVFNWGYDQTLIWDWLSGAHSSLPDGDFSVFMNPPFSKGEDFVTHALEYGARKVVCFNRFSWWESRRRREFWEELPPSRVYICGDRADCWRHDIPQDQRGSSTPTAHAWFVWERGNPPGTLIGHIYKGDLL